MGEPHGERTHLYRMRTLVQWFPLHVRAWEPILGAPISYFSKSKKIIFPIVWIVQSIIDGDPNKKPLDMCQTTYG